MKSDKELVGTLLGFDDYVNMVLEDVTELCVLGMGDLFKTRDSGRDHLISITRLRLLLGTHYKNLTLTSANDLLTLQ